MAKERKLRLLADDGPTDGPQEEYTELEKEEKPKVTKEKKKSTVNMDLFKDLAGTIKGLTGEALEEYRDEIVDKSMDEVIKETNEFIKKEYGTLPTKLEVKVDTEKHEVSGVFHNKFEDILGLVANEIPVMLVGPAGSGKNHTVEQVAEAMGLEMYFTNAVTQEYKITGFIDANGKYQETQFYKAFKNGGLFFFDEIDASCADALIVINAAIANGYFDFPHEKINMHKDFRVVAAANTFGHGADMMYVGRNQLDAATLDRFALLYFDYDDVVERTLANDDSLFDFIQSFRKAVDKNGLRYVISLRATINSAKMLKMNLAKKKILQYTICKSMDIDDLNTIVSDIKRTDSTNNWVTALELYKKGLEKER